MEEGMEKLLERVEKKLIMGGKIYSAIVFQFWLVTLAGYYIVSYVLREYMIVTPLYWGVAIFLFILLASRSWEKVVRYHKPTAESSSGIYVAISWMLAGIVGWFLIPLLLQRLGIDFLLSLAIGLLCFVSLAITGIFFTYRAVIKKWEWELLPGAIVPPLLLPLLFCVSGDPMYYAGMIVVLSYGTTVLLYLQDAFRYIG